MSTSETGDSILYPNDSTPEDPQEFVLKYDFNNQWSELISGILQQDYSNEPDDLIDVFWFEVPADGNLNITLSEFLSYPLKVSFVKDDGNSFQELDYADTTIVPQKTFFDGNTIYDAFVTKGDYLISFEPDILLKGYMAYSSWVKLTANDDNSGGGGDQGGGSNDPITGKPIVGAITADDSCYTCGNDTEYHYDTYSSADLMSQLGISEGENVTVQVTSANFTPVIMILDSQKNVVESGKNSLSLVAQSGFTVSIETLDSGDTGSYSINLI